MAANLFPIKMRAYYWKKCHEDEWSVLDIESLPSGRRWVQDIGGVYGGGVPSPEECCLLRAASSERDALRKRVEELERALCSLYSSITTLMEESEGVAGLHKNGDIATWAELDTGGQFENWLGPYLRRASELLDQPAPHEGESNV